MDRFNAVEDFYREQLSRYSPEDIRSMGWDDTVEYALRFKLACEVGVLSGCSILDIGCGTGGLLSYLKSSQEQVQYTGVDILPEMVSICQKNHPDARVLCANILKDDIERADYVFCIGSLNIEEPGFHETFLLMVDAMIGLAGTGVVLNFLSDMTFLVPGKYHIESSAFVKKYVEEKFASVVDRVVIHDEEQLRGECTMFIYLKDT